MTSIRESFNRSQSFVIRIWWEGRDLRGAEPELRGVIEHIASGKRHYFLNLVEIEKFISACIYPTNFSSEGRD